MMTDAECTAWFMRHGKLSKRRADDRFLIVSHCGNRVIVEKFYDGVRKLAILEGNEPNQLEFDFKENTRHDKA